MHWKLNQRASRIAILMMASGFAIAATDLGDARYPTPGMWELTLVIDGAADGPMTVCIGEPGTQANPFVPPNSGSCSRNEATPNGAGWNIAMECQDDYGSVKVAGTTEGDFIDSFTTKVRVEYSKLDQQSGDIQIHAKRVTDACAKGLNPGDIAPDFQKPDL